VDRSFKISTVCTARCFSVRLTRSHYPLTDNPERSEPSAAGHYLVVNSIYDRMGRLFKQSNPAKFYNGSPRGDDVAGRLNTEQTYDWKGRPLITTNQYESPLTL
jgi:hypothetical protein